MSLFQTILDAVADPNRAGSRTDLQNLAGIGNLAPGLQGAEQQLQPILSVLGNHLQSALAQQQQTQGPAGAQQLVTGVAQGGASVPQLQDLFGADRFDALLGELTRQTGLSQATLLGMLPMLLPAVMRVLSAGNHVSDPQAPNPVLQQFLGSGGNGGALLTEAFQLAGQFLRR